MAAYRYARRYTRYPRRTTRTYSRAPKRAVLRKATGNQRAARQQRDVATVTINHIDAISLDFVEKSNMVSVGISLWEEFRQSKYYANYSNMFDQVCINKIRVKVTGQNSINVAGQIYSPTMIMAFDRNGLDPSTGTKIPSAEEISTYSSAQVKQWSAGSAFSMYQTIYPATMAEKGQYIPIGNILDPKLVTDSYNPCNPISNVGIPFKPIVFIAGALPVFLESPYTAHLMIEFEFVVTFRGMRKPSVVPTTTLPTPSNVPAVTGVRLNSQGVVSLSSFTLDNTGSDVTVPANSILVMLTESSVGTVVNVLFNGSTDAVPLVASADKRYSILPNLGSALDTVSFLNSSGDVLFSMRDGGLHDAGASTAIIPTSLLTFKYD